jgi:hypothetical protein
LLFWYVGLIPDLATLRDRSNTRIGRWVYGFLSMGWRNAATHWQRYQVAYLLLAGLAAPLVISVHSVVGMDFAGGQLPGWHSTIFPPYFVAGAVFSGFAMVLTLAIPLRAVYKLEDFITMRHIENCAKLMLVTGSIVAYGYILEAFFGWFSGNEYEWYLTEKPRHRPVLAELLGADSVQRDHPAVDVDSPGAAECQAAVVHHDRGEHRHVAGAFRHRHHQPAPGFSAQQLGYVLPDVLGLEHVHRHDRMVHVLRAAVHSRAAGDFDL